MHMNGIIVAGMYSSGVKSDINAISGTCVCITRGLHVPRRALTFVIVYIVFIFFTQTTDSCITIMRAIVTWMNARDIGRSSAAYAVGNAFRPWCANVHSFRVSISFSRA